MAWDGVNFNPLLSVRRYYVNLFIQLSVLHIKNHARHCEWSIMSFTSLCLHREQYFVQIISKPMSHTPYIEAQRLIYRDYKLDLGVGED